MRRHQISRMAKATAKLASASPAAALPEHYQEAGAECSPQDHEPRLQVCAGRLIPERQAGPNRRHGNQQALQQRDCNTQEHWRYRLSCSRHCASNVQGVGLRFRVTESIPQFASTFPSIKELGVEFLSAADGRFRSGAQPRALASQQLVRRAWLRTHVAARRCHGGCGGDLSIQAQAAA